ncbi:MAG: galactokinase [Candidatus Limnocylindrales bacterium]|jgi:galactokinase
MAPTKRDRERIEKLTAALEAECGPAPDSAGVEIVRAPGRVNLIGDHTEYNEGFVLPAAIGLETWLAFRRRSDGHVRMAEIDSRERCSFWIDDLAPGRGVAVAGTVTARAARPSARWTDYVAGTAWSLREAAVPIRGFDGVFDSAIPIRSGLGPAAALELASALALLGGAGILAGPALAALAQRAELEYVGVNCGIADQFACAAGRQGKALLLDCRSLDTRYVALPFGLRVVVCDTGANSELPISVYDTRRAECARAVALLAERIPGLCSLRDLDVRSLRRYRTLLPENVARRAEHVISENARVVAATAALASGDLDELGRLFVESHDSLRDRYEVSSPALDAMVEVARSVPGVVAARMTGSGYGGCTANLVLADAVPALRAAVSREYARRTGLRGRAYPVTIVDGAGSLVTA